MLGLPSPWLILGACGVSLAMIVGAFFYGEPVDNLSWTAASAKQKAEASQLLAERTAQVEQRERENAELDATLEQTRHEKELAIADKDAAVRAALASVRQRQGIRAGCTNPVHRSSGAGRAPDVAPGGNSGLSNANADDYGECTRAANVLAARVRECQQFALSLKP